MFSLAILIGIYSYGIFAVGLLGLLYKSIIIVYTLAFILASFFLIRKVETFPRRIVLWREIKRDQLSLLLLCYLVVFAFVNLIGALGPEIAYDALWYHLTLPKLYLQNHTILHYPGGLLYYSDMPKLTEMIYMSVLAIDSEVLAKIIHFTFGVLSVIAVYLLSRIFLSARFSLLAAAIFYSNLVVAWESTTAYVDLARTFFEILALWGFILYVKQGNVKWLVESAVMMGLAIATKLLAVGSIFIFSALIFYFGYIRKQTIRTVAKLILLYCSIAFLIPLPWFIFSFVHTGNPLYPFFTPVYDSSFDMRLLRPDIFVRDIWMLFTRAADPISPLYIITVPLVVFFFKAFDTKRKMIIFYALVVLLIWYITPRTGGGRFILPYLPAFSLVTVFVFESLLTSRIRYKKMVVQAASFLIVVVLLISLVYRGVANSKYIPFLLGRETKAEFLSRYLNFSFGDFYDTDGYFKKTITSKDRVLLYGFHNLYFADFPFIDSSWVQKGDMFNYIAVQNGELPKRFRYWSLIYYNPITNVRLYTRNTQWIF